MPRRYISQTILALLMISLAGAAGAAEWSDRTRDVYVDGHLDAAAQVLAESDSDLVAVVSEKLPRVLVYDEAAHTVAWLAKDDLHPESSTTARSTDPPRADAAGSCLEVGDRGDLVAAGGHVVLVAAHRGRTGTVAIDELWRTAPVWQRLAAAHEPDEEAVAALRAIDRDVEVEIAFGTWCGDSKRYVPELLKALEAAANPRIDVRLVSIRGGFEEPLDLIRDRRLTNVPTVIVTEAGREIGRIVETPAGDAIESDLAAILTGGAPTHEGRWERGRRLVRGRYSFTGSEGEELGHEDWEVFAGGDEGRLLHCRTRIGERSTEIWQRVDADGRTSFAEITRDGPGERSRSRHWIEDGRLRAVTRGNTTGIIEQTAELPADAAVLLPAVAATLQAWKEDGPAAVSLLSLSGAGRPAAGLVETVWYERGGRRRIATPAGRFLAEEIRLRTGAADSRWWRHPELGIPVGGEAEGLGKVLLTELEVFAP